MHMDLLFAFSVMEIVHAGLFTAGNAFSPCDLHYRFNDLLVFMVESIRMLHRTEMGGLITNHVHLL